jgi:peroxiredoxin
MASVAPLRLAFGFFAALLGISAHPVIVGLTSMVAVNSTMLPLGTEAPEFMLPDPSGRSWSLDEIPGDAPALVVMVLSNHCPYVKHIGRELGLVTQRFIAKGVAVVGIMSNDVASYPDDAPDAMAVTARSLGWDFPYLYDEDQGVAKAYRAACTPDFYVFDGERRLAYRGRFDAARPSTDTPVTGAELKAAVDAVLAGRAPSSDQFPSIGCNVKWRAGNEPDWF